MNQPKHISACLITGLVWMVAASCTSTRSSVTVPTSSLPPLVSQSALPTVTAIPEEPTTAAEPLEPSTAIAATSTSGLTSTALPTETPPLTTGGPYIVYEKQDGDQLFLVIAESNGPGRKIVPIPPDGILENWQKAISPDGKWLAFHTDSGGRSQERELTLKLLSLVDDQVHPVASLLPADYPENFQQAPGLIPETYLTGDFSSFSSEDLVYFYQDAFERGIYSTAWSPDGRYLAFAGGMEGSSSDVYTYDVERQIIKRLTDGPRQVLWMIWSPDSRWVLHRSAYASLTADGLGGFIIGGAYYAADSQGGPARFLWERDDNGTYTRFGDWISDSTFTTYTNFTDGQGHIFHSTRTNIETGSTVHFSLDPPVEGVSEEACCIKLSWEQGPYRFIKVNYRDIEAITIEAIKADGSSEQLCVRCSRLPISPNNEWLLINTAEGLKLYQVVGESLQAVTLTNMWADNVLWRSDSKGLLFTSDSGDRNPQYAALYAIELPVEGKPVLVDDQVLLTNFEPLAVWLGP